MKDETSHLGGKHAHALAKLTLTNSERGRPLWKSISLRTLRVVISTKHDPSKLHLLNSSESAEIKISGQYNGSGNSSTYD